MIQGIMVGVGELVGAGVAVAVAVEIGDVNVGDGCGVTELGISVAVGGTGVIVWASKDGEQADIKITKVQLIKIKKC